MTGADGTLTALERRVIVCVDFARRQNGGAPSWGELARAVGVSRGELERVLFRMRRQGLVDWSSEPGSLTATRRGPRGALRR